MSEVTVIDNFMTQEDREVAIELIANLLEGRTSSRTATGSALSDFYEDQGERAVFSQPEAPEAIEIVKRYSKKVAEEVLKQDLVVHDCIFVHYGPGSHVEEHMDFDFEDDCADCTHAAVIYFDEDYTGGEIYFPKLNESYKPNAGSIVVFPQRNRDYTHGVKEIKTGVRHMMNMCMTPNRDKTPEQYKI